VSGAATGFLPAPGYDLDACRKGIPLLASCIPMNNCSHAPQTEITRAAAERYLDSWNRTGMDWDGWMEEVSLAKRAFATLVNASADEIAVFSSVSQATSAVASAAARGSQARHSRHLSVSVLRVPTLEEERHG